MELRAFRGDPNQAAPVISAVAATAQSGGAVEGFRARVEELHREHRRALDDANALLRRMGGDPVGEPTKRRKPDAPDNVAPELLTLTEAATYLSTTDEQVIAFVRGGALAYVNIGRGAKRARYRFTKSDLDAFIEQRRQREVQCLSTKKPTRRISNSTSSTVVGDFLGLRAAQIAKQRKPSRR